MRIEIDDDSTGKHKVSNVRARSAMLTAALLVGMCLGIIVSEKVYLATQEADLPAGAVAAVRSRKLEVHASGSGSGVRRSSGQPRNELEEILQRVAPSGEVMIAISNINLIHEHSLEMWLEVGDVQGGSRAALAWLPTVVALCPWQPGSCSSLT
jgi:hypothetical protein